MAKILLGQLDNKNARRAKISRFEKALNDAGYLSYFNQLVKNKELKNNYDNKNSAQAKGRRHYLDWQETASHWGFCRSWTPEDGIIVPPDAPASENDPANLPDIVLAQSGDWPMMVRWALDAVGYDPDHIPKHQIPSPACIELLKLARGEKTRELFFKWVKALDEEEAKKRDAEKSFNDDNRRLFRIMDLVIQDRERRRKKAALPTESVPV